MVKKQRSFAQKAGAKKGQEISHIKLVRSIRSEKTGHWRFNEQIISVEKGESIEAALKRQAAKTAISEITLVPEITEPVVEEVPQTGNPEEVAVVETSKVKEVESAEDENAETVDAPAAETSETEAKSE
ncbi:MAG: DUF4295 family protein [Fidelibacterota bacterium]